MNDNGGVPIGREFKAREALQVTEEIIAAFRDAMGESGPAQRQDGKLIAPLSISGSIRAAEEIFEHLPKNERRLLASMELQFIQPIVAGDTISVTSEVAEVYEKTGRSGKLNFTVIRSILRNQHGAIVTRIDHRFTSREGK